MTKSANTYAANGLEYPAWPSLEIKRCLTREDPPPASFHKCLDVGAEPQREALSPDVTVPLVKRKCRCGSLSHPPASHWRMPWVNTRGWQVKSAVSRD
eukprot:6213928-Pleurochrysis_carterae.AAC.1